jgi:hypothetical protein
MTPREHMQAAERGLVLQAHQGASRYANELLRLTCAPDILAWRLFPDFKELTESFGMFRCVTDVLGMGLLAASNVALVAVGDGTTPRTGATFALRSSWQCFSVDPALKDKAGHEARIRRLVVVPARIEQWRLPRGYARAIIVAVHSHAPLSAAVAACSANVRRVDVFAMPCCVGQVLDRRPDVEREDRSIASPKRTIRAWLDYRAAACSEVGR